MQLRGPCCIISGSKRKKKNRLVAVLPDVFQLTVGWADRAISKRSRVSRYNNVKQNGGTVRARALHAVGPLWSRV